MCTAVIEVPDAAGQPVRVLAIRDEDPARPWRAPGAWWPEYPDAIGIADQRAGGAWLAYRDRPARLAILLNRVERREPAVPATRGTIPLASIADASFDAELERLRGFNLVEIEAGRARVRSWDGVDFRVEDLAPGVHMVAHDGVDDARTARIDQWLGRFREAAERAAGQGDEGWATAWERVVAESARLSPSDERSLIRDQSYQGVRSASLLLCLATVSGAGVELQYRELDRPGVWGFAPTVS